MKYIGRTMMVALLSITLVGCFDWFEKDSRTQLQFSSTPPTTVMVGQEYRYDIAVTPESERDYAITVSGQPGWLELQTEASLPVNVGGITGNITYMAANGEDIYFYGTNLSAAGTALETGLYKTQLESTEPPLLVSGLGENIIGYGGLAARDNVLYFAKLGLNSLIPYTVFYKLDLTADDAEPEVIRNIFGNTVSIAVLGDRLYWTDGGMYIRSISITTPDFIYNLYGFNEQTFSTIGIDAYNELHLTTLGKVSVNLLGEEPTYNLLPLGFTSIGAAYDITGSGCITGIAGAANLGTYFASTGCFANGEQRPGNLRFVPVDWPSTTPTNNPFREQFTPGEIISGPTTAVTVSGSGRLVWASEADRTLKTFTVQQNTLVGTPTEAGTYDITLTLPGGATQRFTLTVTAPPVSYDVTGTVYGLQGELQLSNNDTDILRISTAAEGSSVFSFTKQLQQGEAYDVAVFANPAGQTCSLRDESAATGTMGTADVELIVDCEYITYNINGSVEGLNGELELLLSSELGDEELLVSEDGDFSFAGEFILGDEYSVTIQSQPIGQVCELAVSFTDENDDATNPLLSGPVDLPIVCTTDETPRTLSVTVTGLTDNTTVQMQALGPQDGRWEFEDKAFATGTAAFSNTLLDSEPFAIGILTQPEGYFCIITDETPLFGPVDGVGIVDGNVAVGVTCEADVVVPPRTLSVTVTGLPGGTSVAMQATGPLDGRWLTESKAFATGTAAFNNTMLDGETFDIRKISDPDGYSCSITGETPLDGPVDGLGIVNGNVTITVSCTADVVATPRTLSVTVIGLPMDGTTVPMRAEGPIDGRWLLEDKAFATGTAEFDNTMFDGEMFDIRIIAQPGGFICNITDEAPLDGGVDGFGEVNGDVTVTVTCTN